MSDDVIVIGGGAAGMMAAGLCAEKGFRVLLLERNDRPGRKLLITGKGRCNVTNNCSVEDFIAAVPVFIWSSVPVRTAGYHGIF
mgnify:CR=1 FL=1